MTVEQRLTAAGITPTIDACAAYRLGLADQEKAAKRDNVNLLPITLWQSKKR